ncbi:hypothetical protein SDC9_176869 [bioreactor metagenome]|uniref:Uncharacterized protein n=1 Tax=bioreactor metagenome TaxID=1076179 RepID=A0A645GT64_9ZZZZ
MFVGAGAHHGGHFLRAGGAHHGQGLAVRAAAPVLLPGGQVTFGEYMVVANDLAQAVKKSGGRWHVI